MRIGIDARLIGETGVGRYIRNLIANLALIDTNNEYVVFLREAGYRTFELPGTNWTKVLADVPWHSVTEQIIMPGILRRQSLDIFHVPYFNVPVFYFGKIVVTIHDLTILHFDTGKATTLPWVLYKIRRIGYRFILWWGITRAAHIIAVSNETKKEIMEHFPVPAEKITVTYEGFDETLGEYPEEKPLVKEPYFLYVGNAYPHKNLEVLVDSFGEYLNSTPNRKLVFVGRDDYFYRRLTEYVGRKGLSRAVSFFGFATERQLANLYRHAEALVFPSKMEGFGLPALEAAAAGCPVICSDIPVFRELMGDNASYFDPDDSHGLALMLDRKRSRPKKPSKDIFSWRTLSRKTLDLYERSNRI